MIQLTFEDIYNIIHKDHLYIVGSRALKDLNHSSWESNDLDCVIVIDQHTKWEEVVSSVLFNLERYLKKTYSQYKWIVTSRENSYYIQSTKEIWINGLDKKNKKKALIPQKIIDLIPITKNISYPSVNIRKEDADQAVANLISSFDFSICRCAIRIATCKTTLDQLKSSFYAYISCLPSEMYNLDILKKIYKLVIDDSQTIFRLKKEYIYGKAWDPFDSLGISCVKIDNVISVKKALKRIDKYRKRGFRFKEEDEEKLIKRLKF